MKHHIILLSAFICCCINSICAQCAMEIKSGDFVEDTNFMMPIRQTEETERGFKSMCDTSKGYVDIDLSTLPSGPVAVTLILNDEIVNSETFQYIK